MIKNLLIICFSFLITPCIAQLKIVNLSDNTVSLAIGHYFESRIFKGWSTIGWVNIAAHDSTTILPQGISGNAIFYYGKVVGCDQNYQGQYALFIHPKDAFKIGNAASNSPTPLNNAHEKAPFVKVDLPPNTRNYRLLLPKANCTQAGKRQGSWTVYLDRDKEETTKLEDASYVRKINFRDGTPDGIVRDYYYPSNKLQWDGKLASIGPDIKLGSCITYYENGQKREEATYQNGHVAGNVRRWDESGKEIITRKTYRTVKVLSPQRGYLFSYYNSGKSRTVIPVSLPPNTVAWYYEFTASRKEHEVAAAQDNFQLVSKLTKLVDGTGVTQLAMASLTAAPGGNVCNVYLIKTAKESDLFEAKQKFISDREGSRTNLTSGIVPVNSVDTKNVFLGLYNPDDNYGIHYAVEVVAIVEDSE